MNLTWKSMNCTGKTMTKQKILKIFYLVEGPVPSDCARRQLLDNCAWLKEYPPRPVNYFYITKFGKLIKCEIDDKFKQKRNCFVIFPCFVIKQNTSARLARSITCVNFVTQPTAEHGAAASSGIDRISPVPSFGFAMAEF